MSYNKDLDWRENLHLHYALEVEWKGRRLHRYLPGGVFVNPYGAHTQEELVDEKDLFIVRSFLNLHPESVNCGLQIHHQGRLYRREHTWQNYVLGLTEFTNDELYGLLYPHRHLTNILKLFQVDWDRVKSVSVSGYREGVFTWDGEVFRDGESTISRGKMESMFTYEARYFKPQVVEFFD